MRRRLGWVVLSAMVASRAAAAPPLKEIKAGLESDMDGKPTVAQENYDNSYGGDGAGPCPKVVTATGSSTHLPDGKVTYGAQFLLDGKLKTAWVEGAPGPGIGESITLRMLSADTSHPDGFTNSFIIANGYNASPAVWKKNLRVKKLKVSWNGKPVGIVLLADTAQLQSFDLDGAVKPAKLKVGDELKFEILEVYTDGAVYQDTAISELIPLCGFPP